MGWAGEKSGMTRQQVETLVHMLETRIGEIRNEIRELKAAETHFGVILEIEKQRLATAPLKRRGSNRDIRPRDPRDLFVSVQSTEGQQETTADAQGVTKDS